MFLTVLLPAIAHALSLHGLTKLSAWEVALNGCYFVEITDQTAREALIKTLDVEYHVFTDVMDGFHVCLPEVKAKKLAARSEVSSIEPDRVLTTSMKTDDSEGSWQVNEANRSKSGHLGKGVTIYVMDTDIDIEHQDFGGRANIGTTFLKNSDTHEWAHGTMVASMAAGEQCGMAPQANIVSVVVLDGKGTTHTSTVMKALDWVMANAARPCVVNLSLDGNRSIALSEAIRRMVASGIPVTIAAGNESDDACHSSPSDVMEAVVVGSLGLDGAIASFSNYGSCVDVYVPGQNVVGADGNTGGYTTGSGTSFSAPLVAGYIAQQLDANPSASPSDLSAIVQAQAVNYIMFGSDTPSPNSAPPDAAQVSTPATFIIILALCVLYL